MKTFQKLLESGANPVHVKLPENEWNFDCQRVPDAEVVACCLWEYARESKTLKELRERCVKAWREDGSAGALIPIVAGNIQHFVTSVETFLREIVLQCPPDLFQSADLAKPFYWPPDVDRLLKGSFPDPWQSLSLDERNCRVRPYGISVSEWQSLPDDKRACLVKEGWKIKPYIPFQRGRLRDAMAVVRTVMEHRKVALNPNLDPLAVSLIATSMPLSTDAPFEWTDDNDHLPGGFVYPGDTEVSVVKIDWAHFTNKEIGEAIARNRPKEISEPSTGRGRGDTYADWRAKLERLGIMRLMHYHSFDDLTAIVPVEWLDRDKYSTKSGCKNEHKTTLADFHNLLPLQSDEKPLSFEPLTGIW